MRLTKYDINDFIDDIIAYSIFGIICIVLLGIFLIPLMFCIYVSWWYLLMYIFFIPACYGLFKSIF